MRKGNKMVTLKLGIVLMFAVCYSDEGKISLHNNVWTAMQMQKEN
jgi:hypothetical protein